MNGALHRKQLVRDALGLAAQVAHGRTCVVEQLRRGCGQRRSRAHELPVELQQIRHGVDAVGEVADMGGEGGHGPGGVVGVRVVGKPRGQPQRHLRQRFGEHLVHLVGYGIGTGVGDLGGDGALLLVAVVDDLRVLGVGPVEREHVLAELGRDDHGGVVAPRARPVDRVLLVGDDPMNLVVGPQGGDHLVAHVDAQGHQVALVALVAVGHGNLQVARVVEHVPAGDDVVPGEDGGEHHQPDGDDDAHRVREEAPHIVGEEPGYVTHGPRPLPRRPAPAGRARAACPRSCGRAAAAARSWPAGSPPR